jgi:ribosomal protein L37AE/L43A
MSLLPNYKDIVDLLKKGSTIEAQEKIMELREGALSLQEENIKLKERISELESKLNKKKEVQYEAPFYWEMIDGKKEGPFCQKCYDSDGKIIRLQKIEEGNWHCKSCNNNYFEPSYKPHNPVVGVVQSRGKWDAY